jgi:uncharacterized membrane protein YgcG
VMSTCRRRILVMLAALPIAGGLWLTLVSSGSPSGWAATGPQTPGAAVGDAGDKPLPAGVTESSTTPFTIILPGMAACSKDSATGQYTINSYVVDNKLVSNPGTLTFPGNTPSQGTVLLQNNSGSPYSGEQTVPVTAVVPNPPQFNWDNFAGAFGADAAAGQPLYPGTFNVGIMCVDNHASPDEWWNAQITFAASATDPSGFTWEVTPAVAPPPTTTTTTKPKSTTTTTVHGSTTTTPGGSTTTTPGATTTSTAPTGVSGTGGSGGASGGSTGSGGSGGSSTGSGTGAGGSASGTADAPAALAATGASIGRWLFVGILLIVGGTGVVLFAPRPTRPARPGR